ncbi:MAG: EamA family transporter [Flavobacteriaceae bacterium]|nr:EamA family transporter [Flavobacteriaceae bacterium]
MLCISTSGVLGRYITLWPPVTIFWRALLAAIVLVLFCKFKKISFKIHTKNDKLSIFFGGLLLGIHWVTFFQALQLSNVAIGLISIFTYPVITTFIEPIVLKTKFQKPHIFLALMVLVGIYFLVPEFTFSNNYTEAIVWGITSAFFYALRNLIMKRQVAKYNGSLLMTYQIIAVVVCLSPLIFYSDITEVQSQVIPLLTLALLTTSIGHTLFLMSFKYLSVSSASILSGVQPIYGIILGIVFLNEIPHVSTVIGGVFIISAVLIESFRSIKSPSK